MSTPHAGGSLGRSLLLAIALSACATTGSERSSTRIDAATVETAEASFKRMADEQPAAKRNELLAAMIVINLAGVQSAYDVARNPALQSPSIGRIKDRVAGMTADEIIAYAATVSTVKTEIRSR